MGFQTVLDGHSYNLQAATIHREFLKYHAPGKTRPRPQTIPGLDACKEVAGQHWSNGFPFETNLGKAEANWEEFLHFWALIIQKHYSFTEEIVEKLFQKYPLLSFGVTHLQSSPARTSSAWPDQFECSDEERFEYDLVFLLPSFCYNAFFYFFRSLSNRLDDFSGEEDDAPQQQSEDGDGLSPQLSGEEENGISSKRFPEGIFFRGARVCL